MALEFLYFKKTYYLNNKMNLSTKDNTSLTLNPQ